jgi:hypothetical protein
MDSNRLGNRFSVEENTSIDKWFFKGVQRRIHR